MRLTPGHGHVESHFLKAVSPHGERALWIRHTLLVPNDVADVGIAEVWAIAFERGRGPIAAAKSVFPLRDARLEDAPFSYRVGDSVLTEGRVEGRARSSGHALSWSLSFEAADAPFRPYPNAAMYTGPFPKQKTLTPLPSATISGRFSVDGDTFAVTDWRGMQGHNWGAGHSERYAWVHCNSFRDEGASTWLEAMTARVRTGGVLLPWVSLATLCLEGERFRFDGPRALTSRAVSVEKTHYRTTLQRRGLRLDLDVESPPGGMAGLHYENPDGSMTYCLNDKLAKGTVTLSGPGRARRTLTSHGFALEVGTKDPAHGIPMLI